MHTNLTTWATTAWAPNNARLATASLIVAVMHPYLPAALSILGNIVVTIGGRA